MTMRANMSNPPPTFWLTQTNHEDGECDWYILNRRFLYRNDVEKVWILNIDCAICEGEVELDQLGRQFETMLEQSWVEREPICTSCAIDAEEELELE